MKILISGSFWHGSLEESYARAFEEIGWSVTRFDWDQMASAHPLALGAFGDKLLKFKIADRVGKWFVAAIQERQPDLVLVIKGRWINPATIERAKQILGERPIVNFNPDSPWEPANSSSRLQHAIPLYDYHFTWSQDLVEPFRTAGAKSVNYLPFAYDPALHSPLPKQPKDWQYDAVFLGTFALERDKLLSSLAGCNIAVWGNGWARAKHIPKSWIQGQAVYGAEATELAATAPIALNILRPQNAGSHNMRTFEIPATRTLMLTTRSREQSALFAEGYEIECYESPEELLEKVRTLSKERDRVQAIAQAGYERVREETYALRTRQLLEALGFAHK